MEEEVVSRVSSYLASRYQGDHEKTVAVREFLIRVCLRHIELDLGDSDLGNKICSGDEN